MPQANAGALDKRPKGPAKPIVRPLSPHLQIWRWHVTMLASILHRATGMALYAGAILVVGWVAALALDHDIYARFVQVAASPIGLIVWFGLTLSAFYHLAAGVRHLIWDTGAGLTPKTASAFAALCIWFAPIATVAFWAWLFVSGKVTL
jgi:succinate dehydrogenase / fumarate reductase cytochrome b subunit